MYDVHYFTRIPVVTPSEQIYRRLGYRKGITGLKPSERAETEKAIDHALSLIRLQGAVRRLPLDRDKKDVVRLPEASFQSRQLFKFLDQCSDVLLMGATAGTEIMQAIHEDASGSNITRGVVLDAAASETVDAALDWIMNYFNQALRREGKRLLNARYSAGYGDLTLENQRMMHRLLSLEKIGVEITESCILIPEKSVTAITGITSSP